ncbi:MAG: TIGR02466 family protein [Bdellovibrionales bacterium]
MIKNLFPTKIWQSALAPASTLKRLNRELERDIQVIMDLDQAGWRWSKSNYAGGYTSYSSMAQLHLRFAPFMELKTLIDRKVVGFAKANEWDMQGRRLCMTDCWINVMPNLVHHGLHLHPQSLISGTYYVQLPKGSGALKFEDPRLGLFMAAPPRKAKAAPETRAFYSIQPKVGQVVLWESWLRHEVTANRGTSERISISFNYA